MTTVHRRVLCLKDGVHYKIGDIMIKAEEGDIYYVPSQKVVVDAATDEMVKNVIDHVSWHKSGSVHVKDSEKNRMSVEMGVGDAAEGVRQLIQDIGYQRFVLDTIVDVSILPTHTKTIAGLDIVLDMKDYSGPVQFDFTMVSGRQILKVVSGEETPVHEVDKEIQEEYILDMSIGCLGAESGNADKLLQFVLNKYIGKEELPTGRRMFVSDDYGVER